MKNAHEELLDYLIPGEDVEAIVFGPWGWGYAPDDPTQPWDPGYEEPDPPPVPFDLRGKLLLPSQAYPLMQSWSFFSGYGSPKCYATYIWTNKRIIWVHEYDGSTRLCSAPRNPAECMPSLSGINGEPTWA